MTTTAIIVLLISIVVFQQWWFTRQMALLMDRVMSNSIHEYKAASGQTGPPKSRSPLNEAVTRYEENKVAL